ncbi:hypothetical protein MASR2M70_13010 [Bacillota bacterium]
MVSETFVGVYFWGVYAWFVAGALLIGIPAMGEIYTILKGK